ncbi:MAG: PadR family transcriptional regulator [Dermatophilus congolensis]|nr:PadR family transcriptional regulator [Dermatophilus congolensis]
MTRRRVVEAEPPAVEQGAPAEWPTEWMRGVLEVCVLAVLDGGPTYGYAISASLEGAGLGTVKGGTLYPLLGRLEAAGLVEVQWRAGESGPGRKYYELNEAGRAVFAEKSAAWARFTECTRALVGGHVEEGIGR